MLDCLGEIIRMMGMKNHDFGTGITLEADPIQWNKACCCCITLDSDHDIQSQSQMEHNNWSPKFFVKDKRFKQK